MFKEIWEEIKNVMCLIYENILSKIIKPIYFTFAVFCFYYFINYLIHYEILAAFSSLFAAIVFLKLLENED